MVLLVGLLDLHRALVVGGDRADLDLHSAVVLAVGLLLLYGGPRQARGYFLEVQHDAPGPLDGDAHRELVVYLHRASSFRRRSCVCAPSFRPVLLTSSYGGAPPHAHDAPGHAGPPRYPHPPGRPRPRREPPLPDPDAAAGQPALPHPPKAPGGAAPTPRGRTYPGGAAPRRRSRPPPSPLSRTQQPD